MPTFDSTDLDNATTESGVVHQSTTNTDHNNASELKQGYDYANFSEITPTPVACWPGHEDSGTTAHDLAGTNDGAYNGSALGQPGLLGTTAVSHDGVDDYISTPYSVNISASDSRTWVMWYKSSSANTSVVPMGADATNPAIIEFFIDSNGHFEFFVRDDSNNVANPSLGVGINDGNWHMAAGIIDRANNQVRVDVDAGSQTASVSDGGALTDPMNVYIGAKEDDGSASDFADCVIADARIYHTALSAPQLQALYDVVASSGTLTTQYKPV